MTATSQPADNAAILPIPGLAEAISGNLKEIAEHQRAFEQARADIQRHNDEISSFEKARDLSKAAAEEANAKIRSEFKVFGISAKEAVKLKSVRNGHLEDAENFQSLINDIISARRSAELQAHTAASLHKDAKRQARRAAASFLESVLTQRLPPEVFMFIKVTAEIASLRESDAYNVDPTTNDPLDFAMKRLNAVIAGEIKQNYLSSLGVSILPESPEGIGAFAKSPVQLIALKRQIADEQSVKN